MPTRKFIYSDVNSSLKKTAGGELAVEYDENAVIQSVRNIFATVKGERVRSGLGSTLLAYLFEPMQDDTVDEIRTEIIRNIREYEPRVDQLRVRVVPNYDAHVYNVYMQFTVNRFATPISFQINLRAMDEE